MSTLPAGGDGTSSKKLHIYRSIGIVDPFRDIEYIPHKKFLNDDTNGQ